MIKNCQQFEIRIQNLLDSRIDPETDQAICAHANHCQDCGESLMAYSLMFSNYLNDSDSMKIKLENLVIHEAFARQASEKPDRKHYFAVVASMAAMVLVMAALTSRLWDSPENAPSVARADIGARPAANIDVENGFEKLVEIRNHLGENELYISISELPGLRPIKTIAMYLDWFQQSWFNNNRSQITDDPDDLGLRYEFDTNRQYSVFSKLACCS